MSRIGRKPIDLPKGVNVAINGNEVTAKGPKGELKLTIPADISVKQEENTLLVTRPSDARQHRALHGLTRTLVDNIVVGVASGFTKKLELHGVGFRAKLNGKDLELAIGFSHPVVIQPPNGISFLVPEPTKIQIQGIDKQLVGQVAANITAVRKPDAYHGKGVRFEGEVLKLKAGKAAAGGKGKK